MTNRVSIVPSGRETAASRPRKALPGSSPTHTPLHKVVILPTQPCAPYTYYGTSLTADLSLLTSASDHVPHFLTADQATSDATNVTVC